jgi:PAS domain S-box-containing protein
VAALAAGLVFGAAWFELGQWREAQRLREVRADVRIALGSRSNALVSALERRLALLDGLHAFVELEVASDRLVRDFPEFASRLRAAVPGVRNLAVARGSIFELVYPVEGNERILGYDPLADPRPGVRADAQRALDGLGTVVSGPTELVQGGVGLVARRAVRRDTVVWGLVAVALDLGPILREAGLDPPPANLVVTVRPRGGRAFSGSDLTFSGHPVVQQIDVPGGRWELAGIPAGGWRPISAAERRFWGASGLVLALVPMMFVYVATWRRGLSRQYQDRMEALVEARTADLARTTLIVEKSPVVLVQWLPGDDWPVAYVSDNIAQFGYTADDFHSGRLTWADILLPEDRARVREDVGRTRDTRGRQTRHEYRIVTADGRARWMEDRTSIVEGPGGRLIHQGIIIDITDRKEREAAVREAEQRLGDILESVQLVAVMLDPGGRVTFCNGYLVDLTGWSRDEIIGKDWFELFVAEPERAAVRRWFDEALRREAPGGSRENPILTRSGATREMVWDNTVIRDGSGRVIGLGSFGRDVTEQRQLELQYRQAQKMEAVGQLAGGIAHDFNNLLQVISGYANFALEELPEGAPLGLEIGEIRLAADRATTLVRQLLAFSRRQQMERRVIDLNTTVSDLLKMLRRVIGEHLDLEFVAGADVPPVRADPGQIEQALVNLCVNARDAMPDGGSFRVTVRHADLGDSYAAAHPGVTPGRHVQLSVRDTGWGMSPEVAAHAFEPFFTTKEEGAGAGLGLSTVYGIVTQADGSITLDSEEGEGSTFQIYLPAAASQPAPEPGPAPTAPEQDTPAASGKQRETILIVDDEPSVLAVTSRILRQHGYPTLEAGTGDEALILAATRDFQLLLTDSVMPGMNGPTLAERVATLRPGVPIIRMSGSDDTARARPHYTPGTEQTYIQKPFTASDLISQVRAALATATAGPPGPGQPGA